MWKAGKAKNFYSCEYGDQKMSDDTKINSFKSRVRYNELCLKRYGKTYTKLCLDRQRAIRNLDAAMQDESDDIDEEERE